MHPDPPGAALRCAPPGLHGGTGRSRGQPPYAPYCAFWKLAASTFAHFAVRFQFVRCAKLRGLPKALSDAEFRRFLASFHPSPAGRRDLAMALCMAILGLRAKEVADLRIGDVNWRMGRSRSRRPSLARRAFYPCRPRLVEQSLSTSDAEGPAASTPILSSVTGYPRLDSAILSKCSDASNAHPARPAQGTAAGWSARSGSV